MKIKHFKYIMEVHFFAPGGVDTKTTHQVMKCQSFFYIFTHFILLAVSHISCFCQVISVASVSRHKVNILKSKAALNIPPVHSSPHSFVFCLHISICHPTFHLSFPHTASFSFLLLKGAGWAHLLQMIAAKDASFQMRPLTIRIIYQVFHLVMWS